MRRSTPSRSTRWCQSAAATWAADPDRFPPALDPSLELYWTQQLLDVLRDEEVDLRDRRLRHVDDVETPQVRVLARLRVGDRVVRLDLARDQAKEFLFVLGQPLLKGAVQAIINPIAIR